MPGDLKAPGMYYEKVILLLTSARLIKKECLTNEGFLKDK